MYTLTLLYFGELMTQLHIGRETLRIPASRASVGQLMTALASRSGDWQVFANPQPHWHITVNKQEANADTALNNGDEIAFIAAG
jgi:molybdopterin converting factor small subunit